MTLYVEFKEMKQILDTDFGEIHNVSDGGYERGYAAGYEEGEAQADILFAALANKTVEELVIAEQVTTIPQSFLINCTALKRFEVNGVRTIAAYAMEGCSSLTVLDLPDCQSITSGSLRKLTSLKKIDFGALTSINGTQALYNNPKLETIIIRTNRVCTLTNVNSLDGTPIANGTGFIFVPDNLVEQYKEAANWKTYKNQVKPLSELEGEA